MKKIKSKENLEEKLQSMAVNVIQFNKFVKRMKDRIEQDIMQIEKYKSMFENQKLITNKIELLKRVIVGTRYGLDRQNVRIYDIDKDSIK